MTTRQGLDPSVLRAYDIRGVVGETLTEADMTSIGRAFATEMSGRNAKTVAVGFDGRLTSPAMAAALVEGLVQSGAEVVRTEMGPSPMAYFASYELGTDACLMVTGSHNPPEFNGLKMSLNGKAFYGNDILELGQRIARQDYIDATGMVVEEPVFDRYVERLLSDFEGSNELRVAWDPGNGAAGDVTQAITDRLPGHHVLINEKIDGTFPAHHPDPTVENNLAQLKDLVARENCDLGIAFDGDGDRIGVIDGLGRVLWGDQLLVLLARDVLADEPGAPILCDVKASRMFFEEIEKLGGKPIMWKVGHSHIKSKMVELNAPLAGEMSAHIFFKHRYYGYDDAVYAAIRLLSLLASSDKTLAEYRDDLPQMINTPEIRIECADDRKFDVIEDLVTEMRNDPSANFSDMDGVRVETQEGWWLLRASNTQPALVVRCESDTEEGLEHLKEIVRSTLKAHNLDPAAI
jgi:phosphomannomutase